MNADQKSQNTTTGFPSVAEWRRECFELAEDFATPKCPSCGRHFGIRAAMYNVSGIDLWICDEGLCNGNGQ
jgi:hypothetical protein